MSSSMSRCTRDRCSSSKSSSSSTIKRDNCSYRPCSTCSTWHCRRTPCGPRERAKTRRTKCENCSNRPCSTCSNSHCRCTPCGRRERAKSRRPNCENRIVFCGCSCVPRCVWRCEKEDWLSDCSEITYRDVIHEVQEEHIDVYREDMNMKSCYRGSVFNVCTAYIGDDEEKVVVKWVRPSHACGKDHGERLIKNAKKCAKLAQDFMNDYGIDGWRVKVLLPKKGTGHLRFLNDVPNRAVFVEPYLKNFKTFYESADDLSMSCKATCDLVIQALIHYSIRASRKESMITNLQGSVDHKKKIIYLSAPVIKEDFNSFLQSGDVFSFLRKHKCSRMCKGC